MEPMEAMVPQPPMPPTEHPLWQGSVSSKWMDPGSGKLRGKVSLNSDAREGKDGIARCGFAGFYGDVAGKLREERSAVRASPNPRPPLHGVEPTWRPSRVCVEPLPIQEPTKLSAQPPFVKRTVVRLGREAKTFPLSSSWSAQHVGPHHDADVERYKRKSEDQRAHFARTQAQQEAMDARSMVAGLDDWERQHVRGRSAGAVLAAQRREAAAAMLSPALSTSRTGRAGFRGSQTVQQQTQQQPLWRSASDTGREFCRPRQVDT